MNSKGRLPRSESATQRLSQIRSVISSYDKTNKNFESAVAKNINNNWEPPQNQTNRSDNRTSNNLNFNMNESKNPPNSQNINNNTFTRSSNNGMFKLNTNTNYNEYLPQPPSNIRNISPNSGNINRNTNNFNQNLTNNISIGNNPNTSSSMNNNPFSQGTQPKSNLNFSTTNGNFGNQYKNNNDYLIKNNSNSHLNLNQPSNLKFQQNNFFNSSNNAYSFSKGTTNKQSQQQNASIGMMGNPRIQSRMNYITTNSTSNLTGNMNSSLNKPENNNFNNTFNSRSNLNFSNVNSNIGVNSNNQFNRNSSLQTVKHPQPFLHQQNPQLSTQSQQKSQFFAFQSQPLSQQTSQMQLGCQQNQQLQSQSNHTTNNCFSNQYQNQFQNQNINNPLNFSKNQIKHEQNSNINMPVNYNNHMDLMVNNFLLPCMEQIMHLKNMLKQQKQEKEQKKQQRQQKLYMTKQQYFPNNQLNQNVDEWQLSNLKIRNKKSSENKIIINVIKVSQQQKIKRFQEDRKFVKKLKKEYQEIYGITQQQQLKLKKYKQHQELRKKRQQDLDRIQVSQFVQIRKLQYYVDLRWLEQPYRCRSTFRKGIVEVSDRPSQKQIQQAIMLDLYKKGHQFRKNYVFNHKNFQLKTEKPNFFMKYLFGMKEKQKRQFYVEASILQRKIDLDQQFQYQPKQFKGLIVKDLKIINKYGSIQWKGYNNIENISFRNKIKIGQNFAECIVTEFQKEAYVQFYNLPKYQQGQDIGQVQKRLKKLAKGAQLAGFDIKNKTWTLKIDFNLKQSEAEDSQISNIIPMSLLGSIDYSVNPSSAATATNSIFY